MIVVTARPAPSELRGFYLYGSEPTQLPLQSDFDERSSGDLTLLTTANAQCVLETVFSTGNIDAFAEHDGRSPVDIRRDVLVAVRAVLPRLGLISVLEIDRIVEAASNMPAPAPIDPLSLAHQVSSLSIGASVSSHAASEPIPRLSKLAARRSEKAVRLAAALPKEREAVDRALRAPPLDSLAWAFDGLVSQLPAVDHAIYDAAVRSGTLLVYSEVERVVLEVAASAAFASPC